MSLQENFISNLKWLRKKRHLTQEKLAELCNTDTCYIGQIETNRRFPSFPLIEKIAAALNVESYMMFLPEEKWDKNEFSDVSIAEINERLSKVESEIKEILKRI